MTFVLKWTRFIRTLNRTSHSFMEGVTYLKELTLYIIQSSDLPFKECPIRRAGSKCFVLGTREPENPRPLLNCSVTISWEKCPWLRIHRMPDWLVVCHRPEISDGFLHGENFRSMMDAFSSLMKPVVYQPTTSLKCQAYVAPVLQKLLRSIQRELPQEPDSSGYLIHGLVVISGHIVMESMPSLN